MKFGLLTFPSSNLVFSFYSDGLCPHYFLFSYYLVIFLDDLLLSLCFLLKETGSKLISFFCCAVFPMSFDFVILCLNFFIIKTIS